jgi:murein DD-endopeptidase MepM/ murein hydrolase activator NlpD
MRRHPITHRYTMHNGVDLRAMHGAPVLAIMDGRVVRASYYAGYGLCVDVQHISGYRSRYAHLSKTLVQCGNYVRKGQQIGRIGSTGISTGAHLHLELARNGRVMNPLNVKMIPLESGFAGRNKLDVFKASVNRAIRFAK